MYLSNFWKFLTFNVSMTQHQATNEMAVNDGQIKLTILNV